MTSTTIARRVVNVLKQAGINVSVFSAHSTRSAASLKASDKGLDLPEISNYIIPYPITSGLMPKHLQCFARRLLVKNLGRRY